MQITDMHHYHAYCFRATLWGAHANYVILHHANVFTEQENISWHLGRPFDHTGSHEIGFTDAR